MNQPAAGKNVIWCPKKHLTQQSRLPKLKATATPQNRNKLRGKHKIICKEGGPFVSDVSSNGIAVDDSFQVTHTETTLDCYLESFHFRENSV